MRKISNKFAKVGLALAAVATMSAAPMAASAADSPFGCTAPGKKQEGGAVIGAILGGLLGNQLAKNERGAGTAIGALAGAAAGGYVGCKVQTNDARNGIWADTYSQNGYRLANYVEPARLDRAGGTFIARSNVNLRAAPANGARKIGGLGRGEAFEALAYARGGDWVLVGQNGVGVGYVSTDYVSPSGGYYYR